MLRAPPRMKLTQAPFFFIILAILRGIWLILLIYMYLSLPLKEINGFSWPEKIMASPLKYCREDICDAAHWKTKRGLSSCGFLRLDNLNIQKIIKKKLKFTILFISCKIILKAFVNFD